MWPCRTSCWRRRSCWRNSAQPPGRPRVDTLKGARHANLKELRFEASDGVWRVALAFDPRRRGILLAAGDKSGGSERLCLSQTDPHRGCAA